MSIHSSSSTHHLPLIIFHSFLPLISFHSSFSSHLFPLKSFHSSSSTHHLPLIIFYSSSSTHHLPLISSHSYHSTYLPLISFHLTPLISSTHLFYSSLSAHLHPLGLPTVRNLSGLSGNCMACPEIGIRSIRTVYCPENWK